MELQISYFLISLISALGILGGYIIGLCTEEELKKGEPYLKSAGIAVLALTALLFVYSLSSHKWIQFLITGVVITSWNISKQRGLKVPTPGLCWIYLILALMFYLSNQIVVLVGGLILIYGAIEGTLLYLRKEGFRSVVKPIIIFVIAANLPYLIY